MVGDASGLETTEEQSAALWVGLEGTRPDESSTCINPEPSFATQMR